MNNPPTLVASYHANYNDGAPTSKNLTVTTQAGDLLVVYAMTSNLAAVPNTPSGNGVTFSLIADSSSSSIVNGLAVWKGTDTTGGTNWTLNCQWPGNPGNYPWGFSCLVLRNSTGTDNFLYLEGGGATSPLYVDLETFNNNSAAIVLVSDSSGETGTPTWLTVDGYTPTFGNGGQQIKDGSTGIYYFHSAFYPQISTASINNYGISYTGNNATYGVLGVEIKGFNGQPVVAWFSA